MPVKELVFLELWDEVLLMTPVLASWNRSARLILLSCLFTKDVRLRILLAVR